MSQMLTREDFLFINNSTVLKNHRLFKEKIVKISEQHEKITYNQ